MDELEAIAAGLVDTLLVPVGFSLSCGRRRHTVTHDLTTFFSRARADRWHCDCYQRSTRIFSIILLPNAVLFQSNVGQVGQWLVAYEDPALLDRIQELADRCYAAASLTWTFTKP